MKSSYLFLIVLFQMLIACKPEPLEVHIKQAPIKMCVANQYAGDGTLGLILSTSFPANHQAVSQGEGQVQIDTSLLLGGATAYILGDDLSVPLSELMYGAYGSSEAYLQDDKMYRLEIRHPGFGILRASAKKMKQVSFDTLILTPEFSKQEISITLAFTDIPGQENFYVINYFQPKTQEPLPQKPDPDYIARRLLEQQGSFDLINESHFVNGRYATQKKWNGFAGSDSMLVSLSNISKEYYDFLSAQKKAGSLFNQLRGEVINFPGNIENGYGFFSLHEPDFRVIHKPQ